MAHRARSRRRTHGSPRRTRVSPSATIPRPEGARPAVPASGIGTQAALDNPRCRHDKPQYGPYGRFDSTEIGGGPVCVKEWAAGDGNGRCDRAGRDQEPDHCRRGRPQRRAAEVGPGRAQDALEQVARNVPGRDLRLPAQHALLRDVGA